MKNPKRPNFQYLQEHLSKIEDLKINSHEKLALNLLIKRVLLWNKNCVDILKSPELKSLMQLNVIEGFKEL